MSRASSSDLERRRPRAVILGCAGPTVGDAELRFFAEADPLGFILFRRNCETPGQVRALVAALRDAVGRPDAPVLIDQEGGRVARLTPPHRPAHPAARRIGALGERDRDAGREAAFVNGRLLAATLADLGITVDCAPVCDVAAAGLHEAIGDRAFAADAELVADLARATCRGLLAGGVLPVLKHAPGHGRATADSHRELPVVDASRAALEASDFVPFRRLADMPVAMTAHVVFRAIDPERPATLSATVVGEIVRGAIGFTGLLLTDDLSMDALAGPLGARAGAALAAGCDVALHCNGRYGEMEEVAAACPRLSDAALDRWRRAAALIGRPQPIDAPALRARLDSLLAAAAAA